MKNKLAFGICLLLSACQHLAPNQDFGLAGYDPNLIENQRALCAKNGGRFGRGGASGAFVCYENTRDAGQSCLASGDCQGLCLARSLTCAPVTPLFGCHQVLDSLGAQSTLCMQ